MEVADGGLTGEFGDVLSILPVRSEEAGDPGLAGVLASDEFGSPVRRRFGDRSDACSAVVWSPASIEHNDERYSFSSSAFWP